MTHTLKVDAALKNANYLVKVSCKLTYIVHFHDLRTGTNSHFTFQKNSVYPFRSTEATMGNVYS
jgi:hypothetical protein